LNFEAPPALTAGDTILIPLNVKNLGDETLKYTLTAQSNPELTIMTVFESEYTVYPSSTDTLTIQVNASSIADSSYIFIYGNAKGEASGDKMTDSYISYTSIVPQGFPKKFN